MTGIYLVGDNGVGASTHPRDGYALPGLALLELDENGSITAATPAFCQLLGRTTAEVLGHHPAEFTHPDDVAGCNQALLAVRDEPVSYQKRYLRPDGTVLPMLLNAVWLPGDRRVVGHLTDLTATLAVRAEAERAADRYAALVEHAADPIFVVDADGRLVNANPATVRLVGDRVGQSAPAILQELVHPEDLGRVLEALAAAYAEPGWHDLVTFRIAGGDGNWLTVETHSNNQLADPAVQGIIITARDVSLAAAHVKQTSAMMRSLIAALVRATEFRDPYTAGHELQVAGLSRRIAEHLGLPAADCDLIELGASVHDIGKIAIPAEILTRPGRLSPLEYEMVKTHCRVGYGILADVALPSQVADIVLHHHERLDGSGYPDGLAGDAISLPARIVAVADVIDAMASHRPYRAALGITAARTELQRGRGVHYDPAVVDAALAITTSSLRPTHPRCRRNDTHPEPLSPVRSGVGAESAKLRPDRGCSGRS